MDLRYHRDPMGQVIPFPKRPAGESDRSELVEVHRCDQREALVVKGLFESEGIPVVARSRIAHSVHPFTVGSQGEVILLVPREPTVNGRSEEHTSELQSHSDLVCRLLLEKKKKIAGNVLLH